MWLYYEYLLMAAVVALYVYDSAILLHTNEAVLLPAGGGKWDVRFASDRFSIRGKDVFIPFLFGHHQPLYRLAWATSQATKVSSWVPPYRSVPGLREFQWGVALALFVLLPVGLFSRMGNVAIAAAVVLSYLSMIGALSVIWFRKEHLGCSPRQFAALAFEVLTCPPFALNLTRHLSLARSTGDDMIAVARTLLAPEQWAQTRSRLLERIEQMSAWEEQDSAEYNALVRFRESLLSETP